MAHRRRRADRVDGGAPQARRAPCGSPAGCPRRPPAGSGRPTPRRGRRRASPAPVARPRRPRSPVGGPPWRIATSRSTCAASLYTLSPAPPSGVRRRRRRTRAVAGGGRGGADVDHLGVPPSSAARRRLQRRQRLRGERRQRAAFAVEERRAQRGSSPAPPPPARRASRGRRPAPPPAGASPGSARGTSRAPRPPRRRRGSRRRAAWCSWSPARSPRAGRSPATVVTERPATLAFDGQRLAAARERRADEQERGEPREVGAGRRHGPDTIHGAGASASVPDRSHTPTWFAAPGRAPSLADGRRLRAGVDPHGGGLRSEGSPDTPWQSAGKTMQPLQPSLRFARVSPRTPNPWPDAMERGTQVVGANPTVKPWEAQALLALARQLTPQADERGSCFAGASPWLNAMSAWRFCLPRRPRWPWPTAPAKVSGGTSAAGLHLLDLSRRLPRHADESRHHRGLLHRDGRGSRWDGRVHDQTARPHRTDHRAHLEPRLQGPGLRKDRHRPGRPLHAPAAAPARPRAPPAAAPWTSRRRPSPSCSCPA